MKLLFFISKIEIGRKHKKFQREHAHEHHEIVYCCGGKGYKTSEGVKEILQTGDLVYFNAGLEHSLFCEENQSCRIYRIYFSEEIIERYPNVQIDALYLLGQIKLYAKKRNIISLSGIGAERVNRICESILWEFQKKFRGYSWAIRLKLIELLIILLRDTEFKARIRGTGENPFSNNHIQDVITYIHADYMNPISVEDILQFCPLSRSHFHALFKADTGKSFIQYLNSVRIEEACELLHTTDDSILDISIKCGFNNLSHFSHLFKDQMNISPGVFRKNIKAL